MAEGGLNIQPFEHQPMLLKMRCALQVLENHPTEWVQMANDLIRGGLHCGPNKKENRFWSPSEAMLLLGKIDSDSKLVSNILNDWFQACQSLCFDISLNEVPKNLSIA